jgi:hypothetical protein
MMTYGHASAQKRIKVQRWIRIGLDEIIEYTNLGEGLPALCSSWVVCIMMTTVIIVLHVQISQLPCPYQEYEPKLLTMLAYRI